MHTDRKRRSAATLVHPRGLCLLALLCSAAWPAHADEPDTSMVARGKYLVTAGDCIACHTALGGKPFAGGLIMNTPFGKMATPNLTPDQQTGIGSWSDDQFYRALHLGVRNDGANLYPGLPYPWFTKVTRDDVLAIKAYLFSLPPVHAPQKPNQLVFPANIRAGISGWNALYFTPGTFKPDTTKSPAWNRGAYLVEGLGHCSDCHTPKNAAQAPIASEPYTGGKVDDWYAPNITSSPDEGIGKWPQAELQTYLKTGATPRRGVVVGPMAQTVHESLSHLTDDDIAAMATYIKAIPPRATYKLAAMQSTADTKPGETVFLTNCAQCHQPDGKGIANAVPPLAGNGAVAAGGPQNVLRAVVGGLPANGTYGPMPGFVTILSSQQIADVTNYVRTAWGNRSPANATTDMVGSVAEQAKTSASNHWCLPLGANAAGQAAQSTHVTAVLEGINATNALPSVNDLIASIKKTAPAAPQADVVNSLTGAYCAVLLKQATMKPGQVVLALDHFAPLVYTQLSSGAR